MAAVAQLAAEYGSILDIPDARLRETPAVRADRARDNVGQAALLLVRLATDWPSAEVTAQELEKAIVFLRRARRTIASRGRA